MELGIFARVFSGKSPVGVFAAARMAGYAAVQYNMICSGLSSLPTEIRATDAEIVRKASDSTGVAIAAVSATYNVVHPQPEQRERGRRAFEEIAASAHRMGTRLLTVCSGSCDGEDQWRWHPDNASASAWKSMCDEFYLLLAIAEKHDVLIGIEPELANVVSSAARANELIKTLGDPRIKIVLDPANLFEVDATDRCRSLIQGAVDLLAGHIALAHAKDRTPDGRFAAAGDGIIDFSMFVAELRRANFDGYLVTHDLQESDAARVAGFLRSELDRHAT